MLLNKFVLVCFCFSGIKPSFVRSYNFNCKLQEGCEPDCENSVPMVGLKIFRPTQNKQIVCRSPDGTKFVTEKHFKEATGVLEFKVEKLYEIVGRLNNKLQEISTLVTQQRTETSSSFEPRSSNLQNQQRNTGVIPSSFMSLKNEEITLTNLGCWSDKVLRAIPLAARMDPPNIIGGCARHAHTNGFKVFAVQAGGYCLTSSTADETYTKYGPSEKCNSNGTGAMWASQVYKIGF